MLRIETRPRKTKQKKKKKKGVIVQAGFNFVGIPDAMARKITSKTDIKKERKEKEIRGIGGKRAPYPLRLHLLLSDTPLC